MKNPTHPSPTSRGVALRRVAAAALLALASATSHAQLDPKASRFYEDALTRYEKKDFAGAVVQLKNALKIDNKSIAVQALMGKALLANGEAPAAEVALIEALRLGVNRAEVVIPLASASIMQGKQQDLLENPRFASAGLPPAVQQQLALIRAGAAADMGDQRTALRLVEESRAIDSTTASTWMAEVPIRIRARQFREAQAAAERALALAPNDPEAQYLRGTIAHVQGDLKAAKGFYDRTLQLQPTHTEALVSRGGLLLDTGRLDEAGRDANELVRSSKTEPRGMYLKALVAERQGNAAAAKAALNEVTALLDPVPPEYLRYRPQLLMLGGLSHYGLQQFEKAKPYLEAVLRQQPSSPVAKLLAQIHLKDKNLDRAIANLDGYLRAHPGDGQAVLLLASAHMAQGRHARATQLTQDALKLGDNASLRTTLGMSLLGSGKLANAVPELEAALKRDPGQLQAGSALVTIYLQSGQSRRAVTLAEALIKQAPRNPGLYNLLGVARHAAGDSEGARTALVEAVTMDPTYLAPQIQLARIDIDKGTPDAAVARLNAVLAKDPRNLDAMLALATAAEQRKRLPEAQQWLEKADDLSGLENTQAALALVDMHLRQGQFELAREATKRLLTKAPESLPTLMAVSRVSLANNDAATARTSLTRAASLASYDAPLLVKIGLLQLQANHLQGAAHSLEKALAERPDLVVAQAVMADIEVRQGELAKAEQRARQIIARNPRLGVGHGLLGDIAVARKQPAQAIESYRRAHQIEPSSDTLLRLFNLQAVTDPTAASNLAEQWLKTRSGDVSTRRALADSYARQGKLPQARTHYESIAKMAPDDAEALNNLANVLLLMKDPSALAIAEQALARKPGAAHIVGTTGWAAFQAGQPDRALQLLRDARLRDPNNLDTRYFLGAVLASSGRKAEARSELESALQQGRQFSSAPEAEKLLGTLR